MKLRSKIAKAITEMSVKIAWKAAGQVSTAGTHQPREPQCMSRVGK